MSSFARLLRDDPEPFRADDVSSFWGALGPRWRTLGSSAERAVVGGFVADRAGYAFAAGYQAALEALLGARAEPRIGTFCATEREGNRPRAIQTSLEAEGDRFVLTGSKMWSTMAPVASVLFVVASTGTDGAGRNRLRVAEVAANASGVRIETMPATPFVPEIPHATIAFDRVTVATANVLGGDGYDRYVKPFRTVEDLHVQAAILGYAIGVARRHALPRELIEGAFYAAHGTAALVDRDPAAPETHVALAGALRSNAEILRQVELQWERQGGEEWRRWQRDRTLLEVAGKVREQRRDRAWSRLSTGEA